MSALCVNSVSQTEIYAFLRLQRYRSPPAGSDQAPMGRRCGASVHQRVDCKSAAREKGCKSLNSQDPASSGRKWSGLPFHAREGKTCTPDARLVCRIIPCSARWQASRGQPAARTPDLPKHHSRDPSRRICGTPVRAVRFDARAGVAEVNVSQSVAKQSGARRIIRSTKRA